MSFLWTAVIVKHMHKFVMLSRGSRIGCTRDLLVLIDIAQVEVSTHDDVRMVWDFREGILNGVIKMIDFISAGEFGGL